MPPAPTTAARFLATLPAARRAALSRVRSAVRKHLPRGYQEVVVGKMIVYQVPLSVYPDTYNGHPLWYAAIAAQKNYLTLHLMPVYASPALKTRLETGFKQAGKRLDLGKACIRFQAAEDLALDVIGEVVASVPVARWIEIAERSRRR
ncbi:MAG TPA: DUF1801 domain-containing protein [Gemmatimonadales bacterium]|nr:DUF1801 domain-containing protein [Gemmatimonadales bacterium]